MQFNPTQLAGLPFFARIGAFLGLLGLVWLPFAGLIAWQIEDANTVTILAMSLLFVEFLFFLRWWGHRVHRIPQVFAHYGLVRSPKNGAEFAWGLGLGLGVLGVMFGVQGWLGWLTWQPSETWLRFLVEGLLVGLGTALAEELVFRGWILDELQRDFKPAIARWGSAIAYSVLHFIKPLNEVLVLLPQFFGLWLLGMVLVWAKTATQRLGLPIGIHAGFVWGYYLIAVGKLVRYTGQVPDWVTGLHNNPLAGLMGLVFLFGLAIYLRRYALTQAKAEPATLQSNTLH
ncbi:CPBP family intramembrane glutamic endopeptidase [Leptolyngbya sp. AN02str]|uniref:CPBP family intramembrane glutamic endopeptidase n=1 Tax=Leptolyngbya sp. AN02str TaxID=3423363 RepID=UPI003D3143FF